LNRKPALERDSSFPDAHARFEVSTSTLTYGRFEAGVKLVWLRPPEFPLLPRQKKKKKKSSDLLTSVGSALIGADFGPPP
jgi:hypothetical protein